MSLSNFMRLSRNDFAPMQVLRDKKLLVHWNADMGKLIFFSHQWSSWSHPDADMSQMGAAQDFFRNIQTGKDIHVDWYGTRLTLVEIHLPDHLPVRPPICQS
jgi:hypothetical protein